MDTLQLQQAAHSDCSASCSVPNSTTLLGRDLEDALLPGSLLPLPLLALPLQPLLLLLLMPLLLLLPPLGTPEQRELLSSRNNQQEDGELWLNGSKTPPTGGLISHQANLKTNWSSTPRLRLVTREHFGRALSLTGLKADASVTSLKTGKMTQLLDILVEKCPSGSAQLCSR